LSAKQARLGAQLMENTRAIIERICTDERASTLATLIRVLGDFDVAEDAAAAAWECALLQWPEEGVPENPRAWLIRTARNKAIDEIRRGATALRKQDELRSFMAPESDIFNLPMDKGDELGFDDDQLRLMFTCCHPALALETQVALNVAHAGRTINGTNCSRFFDSHRDNGAAIGARQTKDSKSTHPLSGARRERTARAHGRCHDRDLSDLQRSLCGHFWRGIDPTLGVR